VSISFSKLLGSFVLINSSCMYSSIMIFQYILSFLKSFLLVPIQSFIYFIYIEGDTKSLWTIEKLRSETMKQHTLATGFSCAKVANLSTPLSYLTINFDCITVTEFICYARVITQWFWSLDIVLFKSHTILLKGYFIFLVCFWFISVSLFIYTSTGSSVGT